MESHPGGISEETSLERASDWIGCEACTGGLTLRPDCSTPVQTFARSVSLVALLRHLQLVVLLLLLAFALLLIGTGVAHAQALPAGIGPGGWAVKVGGGYSSYQADYSKRTLGGYVIYGDIERTQKLALEVESRVLRHNQEAGTHETTFLVGPKYARPTRWVTPYGKVLLGEGWFHFPYNYAEGTYFVLAPGAGVDVPIGHSRFTVRAIDFEYQSWPNFTYGGLNPYGISAGVSFRVFR